MLFHPDNFLKHHPNIVVDGENGFFSVNEQYRRGLPYLISSMPKARLIEAKNNQNLNKFSREDQLILMKSSGVWNRNDTEIILPRPDNLLSYFSDFDKT